jgi:hypothetical protein
MLRSATAKFLSGSDFGFLTLELEFIDFFPLPSNYGTCPRYTVLTLSPLPMPPKKRAISNVVNKSNAKRAPKRAKRQHTEATYTLHVANLNTHIKAAKMKENLLILFSAVADVIEIHYPRKGLPGQSWVVLSSPDEANECIKMFNGFNVFQREITISLAAKDAKVISRLQQLVNDDLVNETKKEE